jgi:hypothetical protein
MIMKFLARILFVTCLTFILSAPATAHDLRRDISDPPDIQNIQKFFKDLNREAKDAEIGDKWDNYLKEQTTFNNQEHLVVIAKLGAEFAQAMGKLEGCIAESKKEYSYSSEWLKDFTKDFDEAYIARNLTNIKFVIWCTSLKFDVLTVQCEVFVKDAIYKEIFYIQELRDYAELFVKFSETLDKATLRKIKDLVSYAKTLTQIPDNILGYIHSYPGVRNNLRLAALQSRKDIDPRLIEFFSKHPFFSKPFEPMQAIRDLKTFEKEE